METEANQGRLFVISGPSGVGKGTLISAVRQKHPDLKLSTSVTTRTPRNCEAHGVNYYFISKEEFDALIENNELLEWAEFAGNYYGTYIKTVKESISKGNILALEIDVQGALQVKNKIKHAVMIFIAPPSLDALKSRLETRNTETSESINKRLSIVKSELEKAHNFDYQVINDDFDAALNELDKIIVSEKGK